MSTVIDLGKLRFNWAGEWLSSTQYEINDIVRHGGDTFVYIYGLKTAGNVTTDTTYWALLQSGLSWQGEYVASTAYLPNQVVHHSNNSYVCILEEPTAGNEPPNATYWQLLVTGLKFEGAYNASSLYQVSDLVYFGADTFVCIQNTTGNIDPTDTAYWSTFSHGLQWEGGYSASTAYQKSDVVSYGGNTYIAKQSTTGNLPTDTANWDALNSGITAKGDWTTSTAYYPDDVVSYGGQTYIALTAHASTVFATDLAANEWQKFSGGLRWTGGWATATVYKVNDIVNSGGATYIVSADHTSTSFAADSANWDSFANAGTDVALTITTQGDVLYRDSTGPAALSAGTAGQVLTTAGSNANPSWGYPTLIPWSVLTANATAVSGGAYIANTTASAFTLTLPSTPADNDHILINDGMGQFSTNSLTIARSGNNIAGLSQDLVCDVDYSSFRLTFKTTIGWILT
jgi:hypothetical protein